MQPVVGEFVKLQDGSLAGIAGSAQDMLHVQHLYTWQELKDKMNFPPGRTEASFASNELVLGVQTKNVSIDSVVARVNVLSYDQVLTGHELGEYFFYRQVVEDSTDNWHLEPPISPHVVGDPPSVENPEKVYNYCECSGDSLLYSTEGNSRRTKVGDVESGYILFRCSSCQSSKHHQVEDVKEGGLRWLVNEQQSHVETPSDPKRVAIIEKFIAGIKTGLNDSTAPLAKDAVIHKYCTALENEIHNLFQDKPREYKARVFTLSFNLSDTKNESLRRRILQGQFSPRELAVATSQELASEDMQEKRKEQLDKYYHTQVLKRKDVEEESDASKKAKVVQQVPMPLLSAASNEPAHVAEPVKEVPRVMPVAHPAQTPIKPAVIAEPPQFAPPVVASPAPIPVRPPPAAEVQGHSVDISSLPELFQYAEKLKKSLSELSSAPLREHAHLFVDYYVRHIHP